jgi:AMIN domain
MKPIAALAISAITLLAQTERPPLRSVSAVRNWSLTDVTRVAIEVSGDFQFRSDRLHDPERVYFDILNSRPLLDSKRIYSKELDDKLVKRIRVAETNPGITRVVLDLAASVEVSTSQLSNPNRLMIEVRSGTGPVRRKWNRQRLRSLTSGIRRRRVCRRPRSSLPHLRHPFRANSAEPPGTPATARIRSPVPLALSWPVW